MSSAAGRNLQAMDKPFLGSVALRRGELTRNDLRTRFRPIFRDVYIARDADMTAAVKAWAAWLSTGATLCGMSAAAVHGTKWLDPQAPAEIVRANPYGQKNMVVRRYQMADDDVCLAKSMRVTTPARTAFDLGRRLPLEAGVQRLDALMQSSDVKVAEIKAVAERHPRVRGLRQLRQTLELVDAGAESPQETRVRLLLIGAGFPKPETQIEFRDLHIRVDLGWRDWKVAVEYDGIQHWTDGRQRSWDIERIALLDAAGWIVIRVSAEMLSRPNVILDRVAAALISRGCPKTW
jgi:very-short-patch-repair endonuclease